MFQLPIIKSHLPILVLCDLFFLVPNLSIPIRDVIADAVVTIRGLDLGGMSLKAGVIMFKVFAWVR